ncbi:MAG: tetratricopeptide repeat protein [Ignavibacteria bacterium]|nr:tetratricopeptide repeat protein [Ignavibacteria bacterium]
MIIKILNDYRFHLFLLIISPLLVYYPVIHFSLTGCDDLPMFVNLNSLIASNASALNIINSPFIFENGLFYRPLVTASFYLTLLITNELYVHYLLNILIHTFNVILLYVLLKNLALNKAPAFLITLIFALNPVLVNSVAWLPGRNDSLLVLFTLSSFIFLIKYFEKKNYLFLTLHVILLFSAFVTKETGLLAIAVFAVFQMITKGFPKRKFDFLPAMGWAAAAGLWYYLRSLAINETAETGFAENVLFLLQAAGKILLPVNLSVLPVIKDTSNLYGMIAVILVIVLYFYTAKENRKLYLFGIFFSIIFLLPSLINVNPEYSENIMLESRLYLPAIGIFISISQIDFFRRFGADIMKSKKNDLLYPAITGLLIAGIFGYNTFVYSQNYKNEIYFWDNAVENSPSLDLSFSGKGSYYLQKEKFEESINYYKKAVELNPGQGLYYLKIAYCYTRLNMTNESEEYYRKAVAIFPGDHDANLILGIICYKKGNFEEAEKFLIKASASNLNDSQPEIYLLNLYFKTGSYIKAKSIAQKLKDKNVKIPDEVEKTLFK